MSTSGRRYPPALNYEEVVETILSGLRRYFETSGFSRAVVGLSGGLDSSTASFLATMALGRENVYLYILPSKATSRVSLQNALNVINILGIPRKNWQIIDINPIVEVIKGTLGTRDKKAIGNIMARVRMTILYHKALENNALVVGASDKSELLLGYFTKFGDGGADILPLGDLYKTQVRELARYVGVPNEIIERPSSPELWIGQTAESELGYSYDILDPILYLKFELGFSDDEIVDELKVDRKIVEFVNERYAKNLHKLTMPPIIKVQQKV